MTTTPLVSSFQAQIRELPTSTRPKLDKSTLAMRIAVRLSTFGALIGLSSTNFYTQPINDFASREFSSASSVLGPLLQVANGITYSTLWAAAYLGVILPPVLNSTEADLMSTGLSGWKKALIKTAAFAAGITSSFFLFSNQETTTLGSIVNTLTQGALITYSADATLSLIRESLQSSEGQWSQSIPLFLRSCVALLSGETRRQDLDPELDRTRADYVRQLRANLHYYQRTTQAKKEAIIEALQPLKQSPKRWIQYLLTPFGEDRPLCTSFVSQVAHSVPTLFFTSINYALIQEMIYRQLDPSIDSLLCKRTIALLGGLMPIPAIYKFTGDTIQSIFGVAHRIFNRSIGPSVGDIVLPQFAHPTKISWMLSAGFSGVKNCQSAHQLGLGSPETDLLWASSLLLVASLGLDEIEAAAKGLTVKLSCLAQTEKGQEKQRHQERLIQTERDLSSLLAIMERCPSNILEEFRRCLSQDGDA